MIELVLIRISYSIKQLDIQTLGSCNVTRVVSVTHELSSSGMDIFIETVDVTISTRFQNLDSHFPLNYQNNEPLPQYNFLLSTEIFIFSIPSTLLLPGS